VGGNAWATAYGSVVKPGGRGQSGQAIKGASKNWFCLPFLTQIFRPSCCGACRDVQQRFWVKECDILGGGVEACCDPSCIFSGGQDPQLPMIYTAAYGNARFQAGNIVLSMETQIFQLTINLNLVKITAWLEIQGPSAKLKMAHRFLQGAQA